MEKKIILMFSIVFLLIINIGTGQANTIKKMENSPAFAALSYSPKSHNFGDMEKGIVNSTTFEIWNSGCCTLSYEITENVDWVQVNPTSGNSIGEHDIITVSINTEELTIGLHEYNISIQSSSGNGFFTIFVNILGNEIIDITVDDAWDLCSSVSNGIQIPIDVRTDSEWKNEHIDTPYPENPQHHNYLEWNNPDTLEDFLTYYEGKEIVLYCKLGGRSSAAADILVDNNFNGVIFNMIGGITEWKNQGYPVKGYTDLDLMDIQGGFGSITFNIKNNGSYNTENVSILVKVNGGIFSAINFEFNSSPKEILLPDATISIDTKNEGFLFGVGLIEINITVMAKNAEELFLKEEAVIVGPFVILR